MPVYWLEHTGFQIRCLALARLVLAELERMLERHAVLAERHLWLLQSSVAV